MKVRLLPLWLTDWLLFQPRPRGRTLLSSLGDDQPGQLDTLRIVGSRSHPPRRGGEHKRNNGVFRPDWFNRKFLRASHFMNTDICTAQLQATNHAVRTWAIEARRSATSAVAIRTFCPNWHC